MIFFSNSFRNGRGLYIVMHHYQSFLQTEYKWQFLFAFRNPDQTAAGEGGFLCSEIQDGDALLFSKYGIALDRYEGRICQEIGAI